MREAKVTLPDDTDWFLEKLVDIANHSGVELSITLQVSGLLVSGMLVSGAKYFDGFASDIASAFTDETIAQALRETVSKQGHIYKTQESDSCELRPAPQFIHLKNARFFNTSGNPIPTNRGVWWRGRISEVSGFTLGSLTLEK
jgi:hypothetical protein